MSDTSTTNQTPPSQQHTDPTPTSATDGPTRRHRRRRTHRRKIMSPLLSDPYIRMATYVAMAHAGLALSLILLYGVAKLLQNYRRPIGWAVLCSIPLRELHTALVAFWSHYLSLGLPNALLAIPLSFLHAANSSFIDSHNAFLTLLRYPDNNSSSSSSSSSSEKKRAGFSKLMQWLISFALFVLLHERIGILSIPTFVIPCFLAYITSAGTVTVKKLSSISSRKFGAVGTDDAGGGRGYFIGLRISRWLRNMMIRGLKSTVGIGLILFMIVGSVFGLVFFSYKIAMEGKNAMLSLKAHLDENNYAERIGVNKWMSDNHIPEMIDSYANKFYETMSQNIDSLAVYYNVTEIVDGMKKAFLATPSKSSIVVSSSSFSNSSSSKVSVQVHVKPLSEKLNDMHSRMMNGEWSVIYMDINGLLWEFLSLITREDLMEKIKGFLLQSLDVYKRLLSSSTMVLTGGANVLFFMVFSIVSGAAGLVNFISELMVFLWLLYYLITSESGGVIDKVLEMVPISKSMRVRCAQVLDHAVTSVLLATAKVTFFQGCLTYLLFRFYRIHFLYMSTFLALVSAVFPITLVSLLPSIPAAAQLGMEARYVEAVLLTVIHQVLLEYGSIAIQDEVPGQNAYLTGLSILGGIALFPYALEGAIMGPLLMTVMIALKNLYVEFVLGSTNNASA